MIKIDKIDYSGWVYDFEMAGIPNFVAENIVIHNCAKKKYMFDILYSEGVRYQEPKMKVMGIEIVRSSTPSVVKEYLKTAAKMCLSGNEKELHEYVEYVKKQFFSLDYTQVSFPRGCNGISTYASDSGIYKSGTPMHVRAALLHNHYLKEMGLHTKYPLISDGDKIKFIALNKKNPFREDVIGFHNKLPDEFDIVKYIDWEMQFQKAFIAPLEAITSSIDWATKEQPSLDSLFD
jgi:DNA polymerase elongation subunit (family B)